MSATGVQGRAARVLRGMTPAHLTAEQAAVWSALRLAVTGSAGAPVPLHDVLGPLHAIDPATAGQLLRVELLLEALAVDPRSGVTIEQEFGGGAPRYGLRSA